MSRETVLVDADWVEAHLDDPKVVLVEVDEDTSAYDQNHIRGRRPPGLAHGPAGPGPPRLRGQGRLRGAAVEARASRNDDTVVLYGGNNNWFAAYAYWYFKLYGHERRPPPRRRPQEVGARLPRARRRRRRRARRRTYTAQEPDTSIRAFRDEVVAAIGTKNLVDVRSPDEFAGQLLAPAHLPQEQAQRAGHIPTARNIPWSQGRERRRHVQGRRRAARSSTRTPASTSSKDTIAYCRIGERSAHTWFALHELLGQPNVKNYDGSWTEYGSLVGVPIEMGTSAEQPMCGAPAGGPDLDGVDLANEAVIQGIVVPRGAPVAAAYVRLLDSSGEFTAEVPCRRPASSASSPRPARGPSACSPRARPARPTARSPRRSVRSLAWT